MKRWNKKIKILSAVLSLTLLSEFIGETNVMAAVDSTYIGTNAIVYTNGVNKDVYDNYKYEKNKDGNTITITGYSGNEEHVEIPSMIDGLKVTVIKDNAFATAKMKSVKIPEGVTIISIIHNTFKYYSITV